MSDECELEVLASMSNYYDWIMETFTPFVRGHVIQYGAGVGTISQRLEPLAERLTLVEPATEFVPQLRSKFQGKLKVEVAVESLEQHAGDSATAIADTVVVVNVLEHIKNDHQALTDLFRMLCPGGHLLVFVPALQALMSKIDPILGHYRRYNVADLSAKVAQAGGEVRLCRYFDLFGVLPWFVLNKLMGSTRFNTSFIHVHDKFIVPVSRAVERTISPPIGKNLILVGRRA